MVTEIITKIIDAIISNIDFMYLFAVNLITYLGINVVDELNKDKVVGTWIKTKNYYLYFNVLFCGFYITVFYVA